MELAAAGSHTNGHWQASPCCLSCSQAGDALVAQTTPGGDPVHPTPARQALQRVSVPVVGVLVSDDPGTWKMQQHVTPKWTLPTFPLLHVLLAGWRCTGSPEHPRRTSLASSTCRAGLTAREWAYCCDSVRGPLDHQAEDTAVC